MCSIREITDDRKFQILIPEEEIREKVKALGRRISEDYRERHPILIGVLNGSFIFLADLIRELDIDCEVDFIKISSYGDKPYSSGRIELLKEVDRQITGRDVLVVEDVVDSGRSVKFLKDRLSRFNPRSIKIVSLLVKQRAIRGQSEIDYVGFLIPDHFVVGYGLDFAGNLRNLRSIYMIKRG